MQESTKRVTLSFEVMNELLITSARLAEVANRRPYPGRAADLKRAVGRLNEAAAAVRAAASRVPYHLI